MDLGEKNAIYWVSFLDGLQRVLLFIDDFKSAYCACQVFYFILCIIL